MTEIETLLFLGSIVLALLLFAAIPFLYKFNKTKNNIDYLKSEYENEYKNTPNTYILFLNSINNFNEVFKIYPCEGIGALSVADNEIKFSGGFLSGSEITERCEKSNFLLTWIGSDSRNGRYFWFKIECKNNFELMCGTSPEKEARRIFNAVNK
jgi:hypothetical protein